MSERALYYPFIHIRDVNWLKATLLLFSQVRRMVPTMFTPSDGPGVREFAEYFTGREPFLQPAATARRDRRERRYDNSRSRSMARRRSEDSDGPCRSRKTCR